ncbi:MAG TPA: serine protease, partial [Aggregatilineales bacterium]|nr:serine protease [Aggregatilineales bacterium]
LTQGLERSLVWIESTPRTRFAPEHGTGVILSADGLVLTNAHVISFGDISGEIKVALVVGSRLIERQVTIIGIAPCEDLALLDMVGDDYIPIPINPDPTIGLGTEIFILGYGQSTLSSNVSIGFARGEISRTLVTFSPYQALIEHTAELLPSDSGSPLFNRMGEMIGMNTLMDVQGRGRRASYAIAQARIQTALAYLQIQEPPTVNYELGAEGDMPIYRLTDYFDRHCYTIHLREASTLMVSAPPQESHLFSPILSVYDAQNQLMVPSTRLTAEANYTTAITIPTAGSYTVVIGRESTTTSGADKLGDYTLSIRQEN